MHYKSKKYPNLKENLLVYYFSDIQIHLPIIKQTKKNLKTKSNIQMVCSAKGEWGCTCNVSVCVWDAESR